MFAFMVIFGRKRNMFFSEGWDETEPLYPPSDTGRVEFKMYVAM